MQAHAKCVPKKSCRWQSFDEPWLTRGIAMPKAKPPAPLVRGNLRALPARWLWSKTDIFVWPRPIFQALRIITFLNRRYKENVRWFFKLRILLSTTYIKRDKSITWWILDGFRNRSLSIFGSCPTKRSTSQPMNQSTEHTAHSAQRNLSAWSTTRQYSNTEQGVQFAIYCADKRDREYHVYWIPFGDHPLKLERYRED